ncbi:putative reverse transcriptase domain-containing protein [Tanacetum coccineum]
MNQFCKMKGIKREFCVARTPQQNGVAERKNKTLIEAARTMLADSKLPTTFWAEAVNTACYVQNRVLVIKPHNKTPYELFHGRTPSLSFMRPFGCPVTILNTLNHLGKFDGKAGEVFFVGYSVNSKAFRVFNSRTRIVEETLHITFLENKPNVAGRGPTWLFDIDTLTKSMNYKPVIVGNQSNGNVGTNENIGVSQVGKKTVPDQEYILLPLWTSNPSLSKGPKNTKDYVGKKVTEVPETESGNINIVSSTVNTASIKDNFVDENIIYGCADDLNMPNFEEIVYTDDDEDVDAETNMTNLDTHIPISPIPTTRIHKDHQVEQIIGDIHSTPQTRRMTKRVTDHGMFSSVQQRINHKDFQNCLFACFLSQVEPKKVIQELTDLSWFEAMQDELLQFKLQQVWTLVNLPYSKRAIGTKWIYRNKKDERGIVVRNKARLVTQGYTQEEGLDYDEVFALVARIEAIRLFLAYASFKDFIVYQMDVKSAFLYGKIEEEVYVCQPPGFEDPKFPDRVYKVEKALYGLHQAPRAWYETLSTYLLENQFQRGIIDKTLFIKKFKGDILLKFQMSSMGELTFFLGLQVTQKDDGIFINQDKYVDEILKKFGFLTVKTASTPMETLKPLMKDENAEDVDVHLYRSMIGSLMYLRPDILYLKGQPRLGLWYPKDSPFDLEAYTNSDYVGTSLAGNPQQEFWTSAKVKTVNGERQIQALVDKKKVIISETSIRSDLKLDNAEGTDCLPTATIFAELERMGYENLTQKLTFYKAYFSSQWKFLIHTILQCLSAKTTSWNEFSSTMASAIICLATNQKFNLSKYIFDNMVKNLEGGVKFLMYPRFVVKQLEKKKKSRSHRLRRLYKVGSSRRIESSEESLDAQEDASKQERKIVDLDVDAEVTLVDETQEGNDADMMFDTGVLEGDEVVVETKEPISVATTITSLIPISAAEVITTASATTVEETLAQTLMEIKAAKPKAVTTAATIVTPGYNFSPAQPSIKDKGKGIMHEPEKPVKFKGKDQIAFDEELAKKLDAEIQAELVEEERIARQKEEEANIALIES